MQHDREACPMEALFDPRPHSQGFRLVALKSGAVRAKLTSDSLRGPSSGCCNQQQDRLTP